MPFEYELALIGEIADNKGQVRKRLSGTEKVILDLIQANSTWQADKSALSSWPKPSGRQSFASAIQSVAWKEIISSPILDYE